MIYYTISVVNAKGSGRLRKSGSWSFTVDSSIYTFAPIDYKRLSGLEDLSQALAEWLVDEFGFHRATFATEGSGIDIPSSVYDAKGQGFYYVKLDVEDVMVAKGDYRSRQDIDVINADMLDESCKSESYSIKNMQIIPRVAPVLRLHVSPTIREAISLGLKRRYLTGLREWFRRVEGVVR